MNSYAVEHFKFREIVRQKIWGDVVDLVTSLSAVHQRMRQWKNYTSLLTFGKVNAKIKRCPFYGSQTCSIIRNTKRGQFQLRHDSGQSKSVFPHDVIQYLTPVTSAWDSPALVCDWLTWRLRRRSMSAVRVPVKSGSESLRRRRCGWYCSVR